MQTVMVATATHYAVRRKRTRDGSCLGQERRRCQKVPCGIVILSTAAERSTNVCAGSSMQWISIITTLAPHELPIGLRSIGENEELNTESWPPLMALRKKKSAFSWEDGMSLDLDVVTALYSSGKLAYYFKYYIQE
eukprot:scaffold98_cov172-Amphora_coffeaeformis.AAC.7